MRCSRLLKLQAYSPHDAVFLLVPLLALYPARAAEAEEDTTTRSNEMCENTSTCTKPLVCIDSFCMCNPLWAHKGADCQHMSGTSWTLVAMLVLVSITSVGVLSSTAKANSTRSSSKRSCMGLADLGFILTHHRKGEDTGTTTMRVVVGTALLEISSHVWRICTTVGVISERTSEYWDERLFFPLAEGSYMLPSAIVISVWMDVANSSMSRTQSRVRLKRTKCALEVATASYVLVLVLMCVFSRIEHAMVLNLGALGLALVACGSGAARLCNALRKTGANNTKIADTVFSVSRSMGTCFYSIFIGNSMVLASRTRKSNPANLALAGMALSHFGKCFLNRSIFTYMCMSAHAKKARLEAGSRNVKKAIKIVSSVHRMLQFPTNREIVSSAAPQRKDVGAPTDRHGGARSARVARATFSGGRVAPTSMSPWFKRKHVAVVESTTTARRTFVRAVSGPAAAVGSPRELSLSPQQERKTNKGAGKVLVGGKASPIALASVRRDEDSVSCADLPQEEDHTTFFERRRHFFMRGKGGARAAAASVSGTMAADMATDIEHGLLAEPLTVSYGSPVAGRPNLPPLGGLSDSKHGED